MGITAVALGRFDECREVGARLEPTHSEIGSRLRLGFMAEVSCDACEAD